MDGNTAFTVPKDRQEVTIRIDRGETITGEIFIEQMISGLSAHEKITAFLENDNTFFPVRVVTNGVTVFINKRSVRTVDVGFQGGPGEDYFSGLLMHSIPVTAHLTDGTVISGDLLAEVPQEKTRLSDCLNMMNLFLCVKTTGAACYINKDSLVKVVHADKA